MGLLQHTICVFYHINGWPWTLSSWARACWFWVAWKIGRQRVELPSPTTGPDSTISTWSSWSTVQDQGSTPMMLPTALRGIWRSNPGVWNFETCILGGRWCMLVFQSSLDVYPSTITYPKSAETSDFSLGMSILAVTNLRRKNLSIPTQTERFRISTQILTLGLHWVSLRRCRNSVGKLKQHFQCRKDL